MDWIIVERNYYDCRLKCPIHVCNRARICAAHSVQLKFEIDLRVRLTTE